MRILVAIAAGVACASAAAAADTARCDAKPFTLNKPKAGAAQKPAGAQTTDAARTKTAPKPKTGVTQAKPKLIANCKEPKKG